MSQTAAGCPWVSQTFRDTKPAYRPGRGSLFNSLCRFSLNSVCGCSPPQFLWCWPHPISHEFPQPFHPPGLVTKLLNRAPSNDYLSNGESHAGKKQGETSPKVAHLTQCTRREKSTCKTFLTCRRLHLYRRLPAHLGGI